MRGFYGSKYRALQRSIVAKQYKRLLMFPYFEKRLHLTMKFKLANIFNYCIHHHVAFFSLISLAVKQFKEIFQTNLFQQQFSCVCERLFREKLIELLKNDFPFNFPHDF